MAARIMTPKKNMAQETQLSKEILNQLVTVKIWVSDGLAAAFSSPGYLCDRWYQAKPINQA